MTVDRVLVVICLKIRTFVVSATTRWRWVTSMLCCDLLENSYLCGISNNLGLELCTNCVVVICLKIRTFVVSATTRLRIWSWAEGCDLLENSYLCGISNNNEPKSLVVSMVVICLKIRTFVVSATTYEKLFQDYQQLWFAWKFVPLWYQQQQKWKICLVVYRCDLLENSYLCGISNNSNIDNIDASTLWFAWKFVPLWYQQQPSSWISVVKLRCDLLENSYLCGISNNGEVAQV